MLILKRTALGIAVLVFLLVVAAVIVAATFDPNEYKPELIRFVKDRYDRTLSIDGQIGLTFLPKLGASVGALALSQPHSTEPFASVSSAKVAVALLPLLSNKVIVDRVELTGLEASLVKHKDGRTNFDDLLGKIDEPAATEPAPPTGSAALPLEFDVSGIELRNATIAWRDESAGTDVRLAGVNLTTGRIASGVPERLSLEARVQGTQPRLDAFVIAKTGYRLDFAQPGAVLDGIDMTIRGNVPGLEGLAADLTGDIGWAGGNRLDLSRVKLTATTRGGLDVSVDAPKLTLSPEHSESVAIDATVKLKSKDQSLNAVLALAPIKASGQRIEFSNLGLRLDLKRGDLAVQGRLDSPVAVALEAGEASLGKLAGEFTVNGPTIPNSAMKLGLQGEAATNWLKKTANARMAVRFDESNAQIKLALADYSKPMPTFDLSIDRLNADRYTGGGAKANAGAPSSPASSSPAKPAPGSAAERAIDLSTLKHLNASGTVRVGALTASNIQVTNLQAMLKAAGGRVYVSPMSANLYQGTLKGALGIDAKGNRYTIRQQLANVSVGPLLRAAANQDVLEGRGNVALDVSGSGTSAGAIKRSLDGKAALDLRDGAIKGINLADIARRARSLRSGNLEGATATQTEKTDFSALKASFTIRNGIAHNEDLNVKSPFIRLAGAGDVDIGAGSLDYLVKASVVATTTGQQGKTRDQMRGITVPVRLSGPYGSLKYSVNVAALATDVARDEIKRQLEEQLDKEIGDKAKGALGDVLKGILGR